jgi:hypothetical protein
MISARCRAHGDRDAPLVPWALKTVAVSRLVHHTDRIACSCTIYHVLPMGWPVANLLRMHGDAYSLVLHYRYLQFAGCMHADIVWGIATQLLH